MGDGSSHLSFYVVMTIGHITMELIANLLLGFIVGLLITSSGYWVTMYLHDRRYAHRTLRSDTLIVFDLRQYDESVDYTDELRGLIESDTAPMGVYIWCVYKDRDGDKYCVAWHTSYAWYKGLWCKPAAGIILIKNRIRRLSYFNIYQHGVLSKDKNIVYAEHIS